MDVGVIGLCQLRAGPGEVRSLARQLLLERGQESAEHWDGDCIPDDLEVLRAQAEARAPDDGMKAQCIYIELRTQELINQGALTMNDHNPDVIDFAQAKASSRAGENAWLAPVVIVGVFVLFVGLGIALVLTHQVPG